MKQNKKIALIICFYGTLPWYFKYFIHSCKFNPSVDFYIITDEFVDDILLASNVKVIRKTFKDLNLLATKKLGIEVNITYGYKLCDLRPAFGIIFEDLLAKYDFWGHCDIDIIFGNIREFITDEMLAEFDLISVRHDWLTGCFLLYKNSTKTNELFLHSKDYKKVFSSEKHYCFDETNFAHEEFTQGKKYNEVKTEIESMMHVIKKLEEINYIKPFFDQFIIEGLPGKLKWENGRMYYKNRYEVLLYHLIFFKKRYQPKADHKTIPLNFAISPWRIYHKPMRN